MNAHQWIGSFQDSWSRVDIDWEAVDEIADLLLKSNALPVIEAKVFGQTVSVRPLCRRGVSEEEDIFHKHNYCGFCGQALDWRNYNK